VFAASDPIGSGFVTSLANPGGNMTGFINFEASLGSKWLELLHDVAPRVSRAVRVTSSIPMGLRASWGRREVWDKSACNKDEKTNARLLTY
jgi:hypothetical protein